MTRFARAKGSKSSNVKTAEDSTPWEVMKEQLLKSKQENEESQKRQEAEEQRIENYNNFLKEHKKQKRKATWCEFPEAEQPKKSKVDDNTSAVQVEKKDKSKKKKKKNSLNETEVAQSESNIQNENKVESTEKEFAHQSDEVKTKKKKNKNKKAATENEESTNEANKIESVPKNNVQIQKQPKAKKKFQNEPKRRKVINDKSFELIINGKEVELVRFDGFPIMKKDAERLQELKNNMIKKGIPKSEVQRNMKLERRRAEKALARMKREVCYNCRKGGHNLSDCPDLKSNIPGKEAAEGVCFKCGSTEHRQFECKVQRDKEFRFATCFICKESGHIARQCPDNPKGLYPNGGCCKLCGDVTHLKKDCHTIKEKKEETSIKLPTLNNDVEDIGFKPAATNTQQTEVKKPKKIKF
ncbi:zinc finger CCHC domain-containing protein 9-like [Aricia agestis]|uniref:zinc finger CCHC domain-containing protein 9-like n=1 Tax=Aricia agestis TaxID=91739 RepID=UPI001C207BCE|nr:zinc finger CCHC domain-containing protein 9-like [Aricia agestis]